MPGRGCQQVLTRGINTGDFDILAVQIAGKAGGQLGRATQFAIMRKVSPSGAIV